MDRYHEEKPVQDAQLLFHENMDRINRAIQRSTEIPQMLQDVLEIVLDVMGSDRAWLLHPLDLDTKTYQVPMETTRPEWPGANVQGLDIPVSADAAMVFKHCLESQGPIAYGPDQAFDVPEDVQKHFHVQSQLTMALYPKHSRPWIFGLHQCSRACVWSKTDRHLFTEIGRRLADGLTALLILSELRESEENYRTIFNNCPASLIKIDNNGTIKDINDFHLVNISRGLMTKEEFLGTNLWNIPSVVATGRVDEYKKALDGEPIEISDILFPRTTGGFSGYYRINTMPLFKDGQAAGAILMHQDITAHKQAQDTQLSLERQVLQAQKMESLGILAGGIAHDFNNLLMAILGNADLALLDLPADSTTRENIQDIESAARRAAELARQMLAYSGRGKFLVEQIHIRELVEEMSNLLVVNISKKTVVDYRHEENTPTFVGDTAQIRQILMNLIINASEAVGDTEGTIKISTGSRHCDRAYLDSTSLVEQTGVVDPLSEGLYTFFEIADTGCGMDQETRAKAFDPFFTTKFTGRGLGLAAVIGIIRGHKGTLDIRSKVGEGSRFRVLFPINENSVDTVITENRPPASDQQSDSGTILIVDDDKSVLSICTRMTTRMGYQVLTAADGEEAVDIFREHHKAISIVLLDLTMPRLDGVEAFNEMCKIQPDVKVLLCSGFSEQDIVDRFPDQTIAGFIQKPYSSRELQEQLRRVVGGRTP